MWLDNEITEGIQRLLVLRLKFSPALDTIDPLVDTWIAVFKAQPMQWVELVDAPRIRQAFMLCAGQCDEFPSPKIVLSFLPPRPDRLKVTHQQATKSVMPDNIKQVLMQATKNADNLTDKQRRQLLDKEEEVLKRLIADIGI